MKQTKVSATFQVVDKLAGTALSDRIEGVLHLFEQDYKGLTFWHGVAEADIPWKALTQHAAADAWVERVNVCLQDGRCGQCQLLHAAIQKGASGDYTLLQLVGLSRLKEIDPQSPHFQPMV